MSSTPVDGRIHCRTTAWAACALGAIAINSVGLSLADGTSSLAVPSTVRPERRNLATLIVMPVRTTFAANVLIGGAQSPATALPNVVATAPRASATRHKVTASITAADPIRFYRLSEVDEPAEPAAEWAIDLQSLDALGLGHLAFEVLVSDRGAVVSCAVLNAPGLNDEVRASLESRLMSTNMKPAVRAGLRVASVRHVELYVEVGDPPGPPMPS